MNAGGGDTGDGVGGAIIGEGDGASGGIFRIIDDDVIEGIGVIHVDGAMEILHADIGNPAEGDGVDIILSVDVEDVAGRGENIGGVGAGAGIERCYQIESGSVDVKGVAAAAAVDV